MLHFQDVAKTLRKKDMTYFSSYNNLDDLIVREIIVERKDNRVEIYKFNKFGVFLEQYTCETKFNSILMAEVLNSISTGQFSEIEVHYGTNLYPHNDENQFEEEDDIHDNNDDSDKNFLCSGSFECTNMYDCYMCSRSDIFDSENCVRKSKNFKNSLTRKVLSLISDLRINKSIDIKTIKDDLIVLSGATCSLLNKVFVISFEEIKNSSDDEIRIDLLVEDEEIFKKFLRFLGSSTDTKKLKEMIEKDSKYRKSGFNKVDYYDGRPDSFAVCVSFFEKIDREDAAAYSEFINYLEKFINTLGEK